MYSSVRRVEERIVAYKTAEEEEQPCSRVRLQVVRNYAGTGLEEIDANRTFVWRVKLVSLFLLLLLFLLHEK